MRRRLYEPQDGYTEAPQERHRDRQGGQGIRGRGTSRDEGARPRAEGGQGGWRKRRAREDCRDAETGSGHGPAAPRHHQSQRASPLAENLVRDARVRQGRQCRLLLPKRAQVQDEVRDVRLQRQGERRRRHRVAGRLRPEGADRRRRSKDRRAREESGELTSKRPRFTKEEPVMKRKGMGTIAIVTALVSALGGSAMSAQDKYTVKVPGGLAFAEFRGYENWQVLSISQDGGLLAAILANPVMIDAYRAGAPGNGKPFPDGSRMAKIHWNPKKLETFPAATVPGTLHDVDFMVKDSKRFTDSGGGGGGVVKYEGASRGVTAGPAARAPPQGDEAKSGVAWHTVL